MSACLLAAALATLVAQTGKGKVAILDLSVQGIAESAARKLNEALGGELATGVQSLGYQVITTQDIRAMLGFERQKALLGCEGDTSCLAEIGGALGADLVIAGTIGLLGTSYSVSLTLLAADQAAIRGRFQGEAGAESALPATIRRAVPILFGTKTDVSTTGILLVKTVPAGAAVWVDGKPMGTAPLSLELPAGEHAVRADKGELSGELSVNVPAGGVARSELLLATPPVKLRVMSDPPEAEVHIDGRLVGRTPLILDELPSGRRVVRVELDGYRPSESALELTAAAFEAGGREPFKHEVRLDRKFFVEPGLLSGAIFDLKSLPRGDFDGVGYFIEATGEVGDLFELGVGFATPESLHTSARFFIYQSGFELAAFLRFAYFPRSLPARPAALGGEAGIGAGAGLSLGYGGSTPIGSFGFRFESAFTLDLRTGPGEGEVSFALPLSLGAFWRFE